MNDKVNLRMKDKIQSLSRTITDPADRKLSILKDQDSIKISNRYECSVHEVYKAALEMGISPYRYIRNLSSISVKDQLRLALSCVSVVGAGGLGGHILMLLARLGIGHLTVVDHDLFDESNLNSQALSSNRVLGNSKAKEAVSALNDINPGVIVTAHQVKIDNSNAEEILRGSNIIVDALDNISGRFALEEAAKKIGVPLVHGAVAGFEGQVITIFPQDLGLGNLYNRGNSVLDKTKSPEAVLGVPALAPALIAVFQVMEVLKFIFDRGPILQNRMLHLDLESGQTNEISFDSVD
jgi:molybdopterin/thiamine biosynthesis adenylyltransferase